MIRHVLLSASLMMGAASAAHADEVTDTLNSAITAYQDGDIKYALEELDYAKQILSAMKTDELSGFLPDAPEGWSREMDTDMNAGLAMMGGGTGTGAEYSKPGEESFSITLMADNPMVGAMAGMLGNASAIGAKIERVGRQKMMVQNDEITGLVDSRILVQAKGGDVEMMLSVLETIDYRALTNFGR
ncbi:MAG: hypothetical protein QNK42_04920 [Pseudodonghicola sp.]|nr:hypothetical protein [Pseudodonghicola sp.]